MSNQKQDSINTNLLTSQNQIDNIAQILAKQIDRKIFERKAAPVKEILILVGAGAFLAGSIVAPGLPLALKPFLDNSNEYEAWKKFNIPYLKRTIKRLETQKLVKISETEGNQTITITQHGKSRIMQFAIDQLKVEKPKIWDGRWRLVSYDIPTKIRNVGENFREQLKTWNFYPLHKSVFLHAYPCIEQVDFLREYLGIGKYVRILIVSRIENDKLFRDFFEV